MAVSPGLDWASCIKHLVNATSYAAFSKANLTKLIDVIKTGEEEILNHDDDYECFFSSFVALSAHYICCSVGSDQKSELNSIVSSCKVLLQFLLQRLQKYVKNCAVSQKYLTVLVKGLCTGSSSVPKSDVVTFTALLKSAKVPPVQGSTGSAGDDEGGDTRDARRRPRLDTGKHVFSQLTALFDDGVKCEKPHAPPPIELVNSDGDTTIVHIADPSEEVKATLASHNLVTLQLLNGGDVLLDLCLQLVYLGRYVTRYEDAVRGDAFVMPTTLSEATSVRISLQLLLNDVSIVCRVFSLPLLEPMTSGRLAKIVTVTISCLYAALTACAATAVVSAAGGAKGAAAAGRDDDIDTYAAGVVQKALEIFKIVSAAIRSSKRAGGHNLQNFHMLGAWCLLHGLDHLLAVSHSALLERGRDAKGKGVGEVAAKGKDAPVALKPGKGHSAFGVLAVALSAQLISLMSSLMEDLQLENLSPGVCEQPAAASLTVTGGFTAMQRVRRLLSSVNISHLLISLLSITYRKAVSLSHVRCPPSAAEQSCDSASSSSDSNTYYEEDFSSNEDSSEDDDSEPILGKWFEEPLTVEDLAVLPATPEGDTVQPAAAPSADAPPPQSFIPDKKEPFAFLAADIIHFINHYFLDSVGEEVESHFRDSLTEQHMTIIAALIRDLDKDYPKADNETLYKEFSSALSKFMHRLISKGILSDQLQESLLGCLGVSPSVSGPWPLTVLPRTLAVLAEVILLQQQTERLAATGGAPKSESEASIIRIWQRFVVSLRTAIINFNNNTAQFEDVNVEHIQLLLFLLHSLPLMQKKCVLLHIAGVVVEVAEVLQQGTCNKLYEMVPLPLSRLILILDYLLHNFYDPPVAIMEQVQWNLFGVHIQSGQAVKSDSLVKTHYACPEVEDNYRKKLESQPAKESQMKPRFYNLGPSDYSNQDIPKIDGLACSFLLSNPELVDYNKFYDGCIILLGGGAKADKVRKDNFTLLDASSLHFHLLVSWRLLGALPPSADYLLSLHTRLPAADTHALHTLRWQPRIAHPTFQGWIKDCLVKQGLTTQKAEALIAGVLKNTDGIGYDVKLALHFIQEQISIMPLASADEILPASEMPSLSAVYMLDAVIGNIQVALDNHFTKCMTDTEPHKGMQCAAELLPATLLLIDNYTIYTRSCLLSLLRPTPDQPCSVTPSALQAYGCALSVASGRAPRLAAVRVAVLATLPRALRGVLERWGDDAATNEFPAIGAWRNAFANDIIPAENYIDAVQSAHLSTLSSQSPFVLSTSLKHVLSALVRFAADLIIWYPDDKSSKEMVNVLLPLMFDASTEFLTDTVTTTLERILGSVEEEEFISRTYQAVVSACHQLLVNHSSVVSCLDERLLHECLGFMELYLEKDAGKLAIHKFYLCMGADLTTLLLSPANENLSSTYGTRVLRFFNRLFQLQEKNPTDKWYEALCSSLSKLAQIDSVLLNGWLSTMIHGNKQILDDDEKVEENRLLLQSLASHIVKDSSHLGPQPATAILDALIPMGSQILSPTTDAVGFSDLLVVMATLAGAGGGAGHVALLHAATSWLQLCKTYVTQKNVLEKVHENIINGKHQAMLESACYLLSYIADILSSLKMSSDRAATVSPSFIGECHVQEADIDWADDVTAEEDDSALDDSDEESLNNKLCTFTVTQKDFVNQHWYHCYTCKMVESVGVCSVCAKVCHKDHELSYAKYSSFFCDCGARDDSTCQALTKRRLQSSALDCSGATPSGGGGGGGSRSNSSPFAVDSALTSSLRRHFSLPGGSSSAVGEERAEARPQRARQALCMQVEGCKETLQSQLAESNTMRTVVELLQALMPAVTDSYENTSPVGSSRRAQKALRDLSTLTKTIETTDQLVTATLGSQEGAFENVRMSYSGEAGQTLRQLINSHVLRRVAMCCLSGPLGRRQHLAVSHEKGKVTVLQLSALLKQADSSKRKLTLTRLASAPIPFTVLSITGNPCNENFLAVCGLKDCHVLTFTSSGSVAEVADHLVLHPSLDTANFIIKALWLPGTQTELAVVTADFVKVYDLADDAISPQYYFLLPSAKIRDATFVCGGGGGGGDAAADRHLLLMSAAGHVYTQPMDAASHAQHGPFYITNVLPVWHPDVQEVNGQVAGGGVSLHYSHTLQLLFFSYTQGKSFAAAVSKEMEELTAIFPITFKSSNGGKSGASSQPLVQWMEVVNHPGLVCCMTQTTNNPVILMLKPDSILVQEIKVLPAKAKIQDMVAIRHAGSNMDQRTTLILLCEDGSLRIYMANIDQTNFWLRESLQPHSAISVLKPGKKKKAVKAGRPAAQVSFPVDYFEHCQQTNDLEFGGNDVLQIYNTHQVKQRLNTTGMYIASTKPAGFTMEVVNLNVSSVVVGVRVLVGTQAVEKAPAYIAVFGRTVPVTISRPRWYDVAFTRDESLLTDKKFLMFFGASADAAGVTMVDSVKVYTRSKEAFGWPDDGDDLSDAGKTAVAGGTTGAAVAATTAVTATPAPLDATDMLTVLPLTTLDRLVASALEVMDGCFTVLGQQAESAEKAAALQMATRLLTLPTPSSVAQHTKLLLTSLFSNQTAYYLHKDEAQLSHVLRCLSSPEQELDAEAFQRLVLTARSVAVARPANLVKFAEVEYSQAAEKATQTVRQTSDIDDDGLEVGLGGAGPGGEGHAALRMLRLTNDEQKHFLVELMRAFWRLHQCRPPNPTIAPVCLPGLTEVEATVGAIVEVIHAFTTCDIENVDLATKLYVRLLLSTDSQVSFACKQALIRVLRPKHRRRRVFIPSPPRCSTPGGVIVMEEDDDNASEERATPQEEAPPPPALPPSSPAPPDEPEDDEPHHYEIVELPQMGGDLAPPASALESLLAGGAANFLDMPPDADDERMVQLAIALSLQEQAGEGVGGLHLEALHLAVQPQGAGIEVGNLSDTTASAGGSDDEIGSTAATDGSTLRTSPAEHGGSAGSESGGSNVDSVSGRSSTYGDTAAESATTGGRSETSSMGGAGGGGGAAGATDATDEPTDAADTAGGLHALRLALLAKLTAYLPGLQHCSGLRAIPFMQVLLMLTSAIESEDDRPTLDALLSALLTQLEPEPEGAAEGGDTERGDTERSDTERSAQPVWCRTHCHEVQLVTMRLLNVLMSRSKAGTKPSAESSAFINVCTGSAMIESGSLEFCLHTLTALVDYWKNTAMQEEGSALPGQLLKPQPVSAPPDMSPFFLRQYVKGHASDVFEDYPQLLTEMVLRLPYQMKKIADGAVNIGSLTFEQSWFQMLAQYMMSQQAPFVRRQVRKLLLYICGSKEKYRQLRDMHALQTHMGEVRAMCDTTPHLADSAPLLMPYDTLITLVEHLKACAEIASTRTTNWQKFCQKDEGVLSFLIRVSITLHQGVAPVILQLLQSALCGQKVAPPSASPSKSSRKESKDEELSEEAVKHDDGLCLTLVQLVCRSVGRDLLISFIRCFLLDSNSTAVRWQAHTLVLHIYRSSNSSQQEALLDLMWSVWPELPTYGRKGAQFVDLLGYFTIKTSQIPQKKLLTIRMQCKLYVERTVAILRSQNKDLANHPKGFIYSMLQGVVDFDGYYLESDPCLVCNNPEVANTNIKLSAIKVDCKSTTNSQIVKLIGSHTISRISLRISELKRTKMVRTMNFYYNNRSVQGVVELKNKPGLWHKAKRIVLTAGQTEVKVDLPLPIVACNLMIEYVDLYDNVQSCAETLQCPRCSASVPASPGVCSNCGENVFQCHKCRAINYDEKDPFLCNACGFCKYAKFEFTLTAAPCCAVDPIEGEDDRKKAMNSINALLEKADRLYKQLLLSATPLDGLLSKISEHSIDKTHEDSPAGGAASSAAVSNAGVNRTIQEVVHRYCRDCKNTFEELSKVTQRIIASRRELLEYNRQREEAAAIPHTAGLPSPGEGFPRRSAERKPRKKLSQCYGCASATVEHCITLIRALATNTNLRNFLCGQGLIRDLLDYNMRRGSAAARVDVRSLLCLLTRDNAAASHELNTLLSERIISAVHGHLSNPDFAASVRQEILLLAATVERPDSCWEQRVRCVVHLFLLSMKVQSSVVLDCVAKPCLQILHQIVTPATASSKKNKGKALEALCTVQSGETDLHVNVEAWLAGDAKASFEEWKRSMPLNTAERMKKKKEKCEELERHAVRGKYLMEKYGQHWRQQVQRGKTVPLHLVDHSWLRATLFSPSSPAARATSCKLLDTLCQAPGRRKHMIDLLTGYLDEIGRSGESSAEFLALYKCCISEDHWKFYLAIKGVLLKIADLISKEIENLQVLEEVSLSTDLSQGYALRALTELLAVFVEHDGVKQLYKQRLVGTVLNGYLCLRRLIVQRTKLIDETQDNLLELLEEMTTGTESETKDFMAVCVQTVSKYPLNDFVSPVFIFERLCSIIFPEENDVGEFFLSLEKDPQQEDFLQGRMLGNPYSSSEASLAPLMRDVKNKICQDCELVALLEDDTGMELLVCNKIISLDLPVSEIYKKIWVPEHGEGEAMRVVYRMRGLLGDATEDMVNSLDSGKDEDVDKEAVYRMASVMSECGGLSIMLNRMAAVHDLVSGRPLITVLLKLFSYCTMLKSNRQQLIRPEMNTISVMLATLNRALLAEEESSSSAGQTLTEQILQIMETILQEASHQPLGMYKEFSKFCGDREQVTMLLQGIQSAFVRSHPGVLQALMRLVPFLVFGDHHKMAALVTHFEPYIDYNSFDFEHTQDDQIHLDSFCVIVNGIERNANGMKLRDLIVERGIVRAAVDYLQLHAPPVTTLLATDSEDWNEFISKPALPYALRILTGISSGHTQTQLLVGNELIPMLHKLEQVSSDEHIGSMAENLMEALKEHAHIAAKIEDIRLQTKNEKKRLAMAMRQKHLGSLGMMTNEKGQVTVKSPLLKQMEELKEETGLTCCICREGYRYQPTKVLGIYTFTKRTPLEDYEVKQRKAHGYFSVSHFNVVHIECHLTAVRHARGREEWESAALQNANTKCNGLLPLWGPAVPESAFAGCLARHNTYLQECTGVRDASYTYTLHDCKHLLLKFAEGRSFSEDSGGGGRQSNIHLVPYLCHVALYMMNTTRSAAREQTNVAAFLNLPPDKWLDGAYEIEGALYWPVMATQVLEPAQWREKRLVFLKRLIVTAHARAVAPTGTQRLSDKRVKEYSVYKTYLAFFTFVDGLYTYVFKRCSAVSGTPWPAVLADYIRNNDQLLIENTDRLLALFEHEIAPCESFAEYCDVMGLLEEIAQPDNFIPSILALLP